VLQSARYAKPEARRAFAGEMLARVKALPGVRSVTVASGIPLFGGGGARQLVRPGDKDAAVKKPNVTYHSVDQYYFATLEVPLTAGRTFTDADREGSAPVVVVNEELVRQYFPKGNPIGERILLNVPSRPGAPAPAKPEPPREIVGVVKNVKQMPVDILPQPAIAYVPYLQDPLPFIALAVRTEGSPGAMTIALADQMQAVAPDVSILSIGTMEKLINDSLRLIRFLPTVLGLLAALGLVLAAVGTYGTTSYSMAQRTQEFGIRMALGARPGEVLSMVVRQGLKLTAIGFALGAAGTYALVKILVSLIPQQGPPGQELLTNSEIVMTCGLALLMLGSISLLANYVPAQRATGIDPIAAMRNE
jgi:putative ABC transport system permease protein